MNSTADFFHSLTFFIITVFGFYQQEKVQFSYLGLLHESEYAAAAFEAKGIWNKKCGQLTASGRPITYAVYCSVLEIGLKPSEKKILSKRNETITVTKIITSDVYEVLLSWKESKQILKGEKKLIRFLERRFIFPVVPLDAMKEEMLYSFYLEIKPVFESDYLRENRLTPQALWNNQHLTHSFPLTGKNGLLNKPEK